MDGVKIDKSFVADMQRSRRSGADHGDHRHGPRTGHHRGGRGIEQQAQFDLLVQRGCDLGQGYWLSHPVTATEVVRMIESGL